MKFDDLRDMTLEDALSKRDRDDLEYVPHARGGGRWRRKRQRRAFNEAFEEDPLIERMREAWRDGDLFERVGRSLYRLRAGVGPQEVNGSADVARLETLLARAGHYPLDELEGPTGIYGGPVEPALRAFQKEHGLKVDGRATPNGETIRALDAELVPKHSARTAAPPGSGLSPIRRENADGKKGEFATAPDKSLGSQMASNVARASQASHPPGIFNPTGGVERHDARGAGHYQASRDGGTRRHKGVDITANPGDPVVAPIDGKIIRRGKAYSNDPRFDTIEIEGTGRYAGMRVKMFYLDRDGPDKGVNPSTSVTAGTTVVGDAQDVRKRHGNRMKPHIHIEVFWQGRRIDPAQALPAWP